jgi:hypothetical protein
MKAKSGPVATHLSHKQDLLKAMWTITALLYALSATEETLKKY